MPISHGDQLFNLIRSLSKAEKRTFKLYTKRLNKDSDPKFIQLFDILDKQKTYQEDLIYKRFHQLSKVQLSNLKRHLYTQILISLRLIHINKNIDIQIREQIDFARILYGKGLYLQSLKLLDRIKTIAETSHQDFLLIEIFEFQKLIESRHITRSRKIKNKMETLIDESELRAEVALNTARLTNLKLKIHGLYIQRGHIRDEKDRAELENYFKNELKAIHTDKLTFFEKIYYYQTHVWYYYILLDFVKCYVNAAKWVEQFDLDQDMKTKDPDLYMRGLHYELTTLFNLQCYADFKLTLETFEQFEARHGQDFNTTSEVICFLYLYTAKLNDHFIRGTFAEGIKEVKKIMGKLELYDPHLDQHQILVFYYKIAWLYFGNGDYSKSLDYLNRIIYLDVGHLREDIQIYSRLLSLIVHYELKNYQFLEYQIPAVLRFMSKLEDQNVLQKETLSLLNRLLYKPNEEVLTEIRKFYQKVDKLSHTVEDQKSFVYLDIITWLESKMQEKSLQEVIRQKFNSRQAQRIQALIASL